MVFIMVANGMLSGLAHITSFVDGGDNDVDNQVPDFLIPRLRLDMCHIASRIIKTISKGVVFIISPLLKRLYRRRSYLRYNQYKHCGFVFHNIQLDWSEVTQTTVTCLNW